MARLLRKVELEAGLKACPFCGCAELDFCRTNENACRVACVECGGQAASAPGAEQAIANWNRRDEPQSPEAAQFIPDGDWEEEWT